jgi:uncharacterized membrane protein YphA (DoxX/SURF4 family)
MQRDRKTDRAWALLFARFILGLIFFMAGFWKVFQLGPLEHARKYFLPFAAQLGSNHALKNRER